MADLKSSFPESGDYTADSALTEANYVAVLFGLADDVGVNGIRVPMIPDYESPSAYPELYTRIIAIARGLGLAI